MKGKNATHRHQYLEGLVIMGVISVALIVYLFVTHTNVWTKNMPSGAQSDDTWLEGDTQSDFEQTIDAEDEDFETTY